MESRRYAKLLRRSIEGSRGVRNAVSFYGKQVDRSSALNVALILAVRQRRLDPRWRNAIVRTRWILNRARVT